MILIKRNFQKKKARYNPMALEIEVGPSLTAASQQIYDEGVGELTHGLVYLF